MLQNLDFSHERDLTIDTLIKRVKSYYPDADFVDRCFTHYHPIAG